MYISTSLQYMLKSIQGGCYFWTSWHMFKVVTLNTEIAMTPPRVVRFLLVLLSAWLRHLVNAYGVTSLVRLAASYNNPVVIPGLRAGTCAVPRDSLLIVCKCVCHLSNKELLYFYFYSQIWYIFSSRHRWHNTCLRSEFTIKVSGLKVKVTA